MPELEGETKTDGDVLVEGNYFSVKGVFLDHKIPCIAYRLEEKRRINIKKSALQEMGLPVGAWLMDLKDSILNGDPDDKLIRVWWKDKWAGSGERFIPLGVLKENVVRVTPGQKMTCVTDVIYHEENAEKIIALAEGSDLLFIEATFLHEDVEKAAQKYHLTARQAGDLARRSRVKRLVLFHFSPKYKGAGHRLLEEAMSAFGGQSLLI